MADDHHTEVKIQEPAADMNIQTPAAMATGTANPAIPEDHAQQTPEFLTKMIAQYNSLRQEQSELFAKMYPPMVPGQSNAPLKPPYEQVAEYHRQDLELDAKIGSLLTQITELHTLLAKPTTPSPELTKETGPTQPGTPETAEVAKGSTN